MSTLKTLEEILVEGFNSMITEANFNKGTAKKAAAKKLRQAERDKRAKERVRKAFSRTGHTSMAKRNKDLAVSMEPTSTPRPEPNPNPKNRSKKSKPYDDEG